MEKKSRQQKSPKKKYFTLKGVFFYLFTIFILVLLYLGWLIKDEKYLIAETGIGYLLGIIGTVLMVLLLLYPVRKKSRIMQNWGQMTIWFNIHMIMGIIGPVLIVFHCNFKLGSLNSRVALMSTLVIAISGIIGSYIYKKINYGLINKQINLKNVKKEINENDTSLAIVFTHNPDLIQQLDAFEKKVISPYDHGIIKAVIHYFHIYFLYIFNRFKIIKLLANTLKIIGKEESWVPKEKRIKTADSMFKVKNHLKLILKIAEFNFYERLFALWHFLHFPLFILLVIVVIIHIIAVHMF